MCGPLIGVAVGLAGAAVSAAGAAQQANAQASAANYNATVEKINARTQRQRGLVESERIGDKYARTESSGIASAAAGGVDPGYGSAALAIFGTNAENKGADQSMAYINAEQAATAHDNKAKQHEMEAQNAKAAGRWGVATSFLNGISGVVKSSGSSFGSALTINS